MLALLSMFSAFAAEELATQPPAALAWSPDSAAEYRYTLQSDLTLSLDALDRLERRVGSVDLGPAGVVPINRFVLDAGLACAADTRGERVTLSCDLHDTEVSSAQAASADDRALLAALTTHLDSAAVELGLTRTGRLRSVDLLVSAPQSEIVDLVGHELVRRAVSGFDLQLPDDPSVTTWTQRRTALTTPASGFGPLARASLEHRRLGQVGGQAVLRSSGELAHLNHDLAIRPTHVGDATVESVAVFDADAGVLAERSWTVRDQGDNPYDQHATLTLVSIAPLD